MSGFDSNLVSVTSGKIADGFATLCTQISIDKINALTDDVLSPDNKTLAIASVNASPVNEDANFRALVHSYVQGLYGDIHATLIKNAVVVISGNAVTLDGNTFTTGSIKFVGASAGGNVPEVGSTANGFGGTNSGGFPFISMFVSNEDVNESVNGIRTDFTVDHAFSASSMKVYVQGVRQRLTTDYTILNSTTIRFNSAPTNGYWIMCDYIKL